MADFMGFSAENLFRVCWMLSIVSIVARLEVVEASAVVVEVGVGAGVAVVEVGTAVSFEAICVISTILAVMVNSPALICMVCPIDGLFSEIEASVLASTKTGTAENTCLPAGRERQKSENKIMRNFFIPSL